MKLITIIRPSAVYATITNRGTVVDLHVVGGRMDIEKSVAKRKKRKGSKR